MGSVFSAILSMILILRRRGREKLGLGTDADSMDGRWCRKKIWSIEGSACGGESEHVLSVCVCACSFWVSGGKVGKNRGNWALRRKRSEKKKVGKL